MYKIFYVIFVLFLSACNLNKTGLKHTIVINSIDSICRLCEPVRDCPFEHMTIDEYGIDDKKEKQWIYGDSIDKYCNIEDLKKLASNHSSRVIQYVAFQLLLKRDSHEAVKLLIHDINNNDSIVAVHIDQGFPESISSLRVSLTQKNRAKYKISIEDSIAIDNAVLNSKIKTEILYYLYTLKKE